MAVGPVPKEYYRHLGELQAVDFVLVELTLYLDTHPDDSDAIKQFQQFQKRKVTLTQQFESLFGPLKEYGNSPTGNSWTWTSAPWPWQV